MYDVFYCYNSFDQPTQTPFLQWNSRADPPTVHKSPHNMGSAASLKQKRLMFWKAKLGEWADNLTSEIDDGELQMFGIETIMEIAIRAQTI